MNKEIKIVPCREEHLNAVEDIAVKAWTPIREVNRRDLGDELFEVFFANWEVAKRSSTRNAMMSGRSYVALCDDKVVGFIRYAVNEALKSGEIRGNAVDPDCRGMGIGPKMYEFVFQKMREEGMLYATVHTGLDDGHIPARRAYEKAGFEKNIPSIEYYRKL